MSAEIISWHLNSERLCVSVWVSWCYCAFCVLLYMSVIVCVCVCVCVCEAVPTRRAVSVSKHQTSSRRSALSTCSGSSTSSTVGATWIQSSFLWPLSIEAAKCQLKSCAFLSMDLLQPAPQRPVHPSMPQLLTSLAPGTARWRRYSWCHLHISDWLCCVINGEGRGSTPRLQTEIIKQLWDESLWCFLQTFLFPSRWILQTLMKWPDVSSSATWSCLFICSWKRDFFVTWHARCAANHPSQCWVVRYPDKLNSIQIICPAQLHKLQICLRGLYNVYI